MKRLFFASMLALAAAPIFAESETMSEYDLLKLELAQGNPEACSTLINRNSKLSEIQQKLQQKNWLEQEMRGINLLVLFSECEQGKKCKKFVKQVERLKIYKLLEKVADAIDQSINVQMQEEIQKHHEQQLDEVITQHSEAVAEQTEESFVAH
jgi:uncharacterized alpha/beta hydrolase family protein